MRRASIRCRRCRRASTRCCRPARAALRAIARGGARRDSCRLRLPAASRRRSRVVFYAGYVLAIVVALLLSPLLSLALAQRDPARAEVAAAGRGRAGGRQPDSGAAPDVGERGGADAVARAGRRVRRAWRAPATARSSTGWKRRSIRICSSCRRRTSSSGRSGFRRRWAPELAAIPGVERVQMVRDARIVFRETPVMIVAVEVDEHRRNGASRAGRRRSPSEMYRLTAAGEGLMVSDNLAQLQRLQLGEMLEIPAPHGHHPAADRRHRRRLLRSAGHDPHGSDAVHAVLARRLGQRLPRLPEAGRAGAGRARSGFSSATPGQRQVFVLTNAELKSYILKITDQWFGLTSVQIAVAVLVAILGIVNTLTVSITDRRRELGVLQAVGGLHGQIRRTIWIEALEHRHAGPGPRLRARRDESVLHPADRPPRHRRHAAGLRSSRRTSCSRSSRRFSARRSSRRSGRRSRRCAGRSWRRWSMNERRLATRARSSRRHLGTADASCLRDLRVFVV